jgi:hypothetical protein
VVQTTVVSKNDIPKRQADRQFSKVLPQPVQVAVAEKSKPFNQNNRHSNASNANESTFSSQCMGSRASSPEIKSRKARKNKENAVQKSAGVIQLQQQSDYFKNEIQQNQLGQTNGRETFVAPYYPAGFRGNLAGSNEAKGTQLFRGGQKMTQTSVNKNKNKSNPPTKKSEEDYGCVLSQNPDSADFALASSPLK